MKFNASNRWIKLAGFQTNLPQLQPRIGRWGKLFFYRQHPTGENQISYKELLCLFRDKLDFLLNRQRPDNQWEILKPERPLSYWDQLVEAKPLFNKIQQLKKEAVDLVKNKPLWIRILCHVRLFFIELWMLPATKKQLRTIQEKLIDSQKKELIQLKAVFPDFEKNLPKVEMTEEAWQQHFPATAEDLEKGKRETYIAKLLQHPISHVVVGEQEAIILQFQGLYGNLAQWEIVPLNDTENFWKGKASSTIQVATCLDQQLCNDLHELYVVYQQGKQACLDRPNQILGMMPAQLAGAENF